MIKAVINIGTNSTRLQMGARGADGQMAELYSGLAMTKIGEGLGVARMIKAEPLARTVAQVVDFAAEARRRGAETIQVTATSAVRDAVNAEAVAQALYEASGVRLVVLTGAEEAELSYLGAVSVFDGAGTSLAVLDIGGGSTELVYDAGKSVASVNLGALRLQENPALMAEVPEILRGLLGADLPREVFLVGVGGTVTSLAAMAQALRVYDAQRVHGYQLSRAVVDTWAARLAGMSLPERRLIKGLMPERADIMPYGVAILQQTMTLLEVSEVTVSVRDLLWGLLLRA